MILFNQNINLNSHNIMMLINSLNNVIFLIFLLYYQNVLILIQLLILLMILHLNFIIMINLNKFHFLLLLNLNLKVSKNHHYQIT